MLQPSEYNLKLKQLAEVLGTSLSVGLYDDGIISF